MADDFSLPKPLLTLSRGLTVQPMLHSDAPAIAQQANNAKIAVNMTNHFPFPYTIESAHSFINTVQNRKDWKTLRSIPTSQTLSVQDFWNPEHGTVAPCHWTIALNGQPIGALGFMFRKDVEERMARFGYWIGEEHWGKGYATEIMSAAVSWAFAVYSNLDRLEATVYGWATASAKVLRKIGFIEEGRTKASVHKWGKSTDCIYFGRVRDDVATTTEAPAGPIA
jgi:[ribosomal protein S5]-alanine N-acetyltransferase